MRTKATRETIATAASPKVADDPQPKVLARFMVSNVLTRATERLTAPAISKRPERGADTGARTTRIAATEMTMAMGTRNQNTAGQPHWETSNPPRSGPTAMAPLRNIAYPPRARARWLSGKDKVIKAGPVANTAPVPTPCADRAASSHS